MIHVIQYCNLEIGLFAVELQPLPEIDLNTGPQNLIAFIIAARDLKAMDRSGTSDPYAVLQVCACVCERERKREKRKD